MNIPAAAIEAAEEAIANAWCESALPSVHAHAAIEAAMPAIREAIAHDLEFTYPHGSLSAAARIVREGKPE